jgi:hypothetical protein
MNSQPHASLVREPCALDTNGPLCSSLHDDATTLVEEEIMLVHAQFPALRSWQTEVWDLEKLSDLSSIVTALMALGLAWLALRFTAKPKVRIRHLSPLTAGVSESKSLDFRLENVGHLLLGRPPATNVRVWVNMHPELEPISLLSGAMLEHETREIKRGKGKSKYLSLKEAVLVYGEPGEEIRVDLQTPSTSGTYPIWLTLVTAEGAQAIYRINLDVVASENER